METKIDFLDAVKAKSGIDSDYALAKKLNVTRAAISNYRNGKGNFDDEVALRIADILEIEPGIVLAAAHADRAKSAHEKAAWKSIFEKLGGMAACLALGIGLVTSPASTGAGSSADSSAKLYIMLNRKRARINPLSLLVGQLIPKLL